MHNLDPLLRQAAPVEEAHANSAKPRVRVIRAAPVIHDGTSAAPVALVEKAACQSDFRIHVEDE